MVRRSLAAAGIALVAVLTLSAVPASAGGGGCATVTQGTGVTVELRDFCITPTLLRAEPGEAIAFVNRDPFKHVIVGAGFSWGSNAYMKAGDAFTVAFDHSGVYPFQCYIHPGMAGAVIVGDANGSGAASGAGVTVEPLGQPETSPRAPAVAVTPASPSSSAAGRALAGGVGLAIGAGMVLLGRRLRRGEPSRT